MSIDQQADFSDYKYVYRANPKHAVGILLTAVVFLVLGIAVESAHQIFLYGFSAFCCLYGMYLAAQNKVRLALDKKGVYLDATHIPANQINGYQIKQTQDGVALRFYFEVTTKTGAKKRVEVGRLDKPVKDILEAIAAINQSETDVG